VKKQISFIEDDFELEKFKEEFSKTVGENYYKKNKTKYNVLYFFIIIASVGIAFVVYTLIQNYINTLTGIGW
jgi:hypothetical protein